MALSKVTLNSRHLLCLKMNNNFKQGKLNSRAKIRRNVLHTKLLQVYTLKWSHTFRPHDHERRHNRYQPPKELIPKFLSQTTITFHQKGG